MKSYTKPTFVVSHDVSASPRRRNGEGCWRTACSSLLRAFGALVKERLAQEVVEEPELVDTELELEELAGPC